MSSTVSSAASQRSAFEALLLRLAADGGPPAPVYERLRTRLIALFRLHLPIDAETLADEALERLGRRLGEGVEVEHVTAYLHGIARLLLLEAKARPLDRRAGLVELEQLAAPEPDEDEDPEAWTALRGCLAKLGAESAALILDYYSVDDEGSRIRARQQLAERHGVNLNALRNRALRLRAALETCVRRELRRDGNARRDTPFS